MIDATRTGAAALQALIRRLGEIAAETCEPDLAAGPDMRQMVEIVEASVEANMGHADPAHREGYLRALADVLGMVADGCTPGAGWDPIRNSEAAFAAPAAAAAVIRGAAA